MCFRNASEGQDKGESKQKIWKDGSKTLEARDLTHKLSCLGNILRRGIGCNFDITLPFFHSAKL
jgi:hypothetical protein